MPKWIQIEVSSRDERSSVGLSDNVPTGPSRRHMWLAGLAGGLLILLAAIIWFARPQSGATLASGTPIARWNNVLAVPPSNQAQRAAPAAQSVGPSFARGTSGTGNAPAAQASGPEQGTDVSAPAQTLVGLSEDVRRRLDSDQPVAIVNGEPITEAQLEREVGIGRVLFPLLRGTVVNDDAQTLERMRADLLSSLIDERLLVQVAEEAGLTITDAELEERLGAILTQIGLTEAVLGDMLASVGVSLSDVRASLRKTMLTERLVREQPRPPGSSAGSDYEAWTKALQQTADIQILTGNAKGRMVKLGQPAPPFTLRRPNGEAISLSDFAGQPVLINFWATWCPPCRFEMPFLQEAYDKYKSQGFVVLAVDVQETPELVTPYLEQNGLTFPAALDRSGAVSAAYRVQGIPTSVFVDREGRVTDIHRGALTRDRLQGYLDRIISP